MVNLKLIGVPYRSKAANYRHAIILSSSDCRAKNSRVLLFLLF